MTTNNLKELVAVLFEKVHILEEIRDRLEDEQRCIIEFHPESLDEKTRDAEESFRRLNLVNRRFRAILERSGNELGLTGKVSLSSLIDAIEADDGIQLRELQDRCFSAAAAVSSLLSMNELLLKNSLDIVGRSLSLFSTLLGGAETYGSAGRLSSGKAVAGILCREI
jgi:FlgN protein